MINPRISQMTVEFPAAAGIQPSVEARPSTRGAMRDFPW